MPKPTTESFNTADDYSTFSPLHYDFLPLASLADWMLNFNVICFS
jgi:hypothetical protein